VELILDKLGRIEHAEIDVRPLAVFVGENNTNKTWAAYCLYGLARHLMETTSSERYSRNTLTAAAMGNRPLCS
jgi:predicted ATPase